MPSELTCWTVGGVTDSIVMPRAPESKAGSLAMELTAAIIATASDAATYALTCTLPEATVSVMSLALTPSWAASAALASVMLKELTSPAASNPKATPVEARIEDTPSSRLMASTSDCLAAAAAATSALCGAARPPVDDDGMPRGIPSEPMTLPAVPAPDAPGTTEATSRPKLAGCLAASMVRRSSSIGLTRLGGPSSRYSSSRLPSP